MAENIRAYPIKWFLFRLAAVLFAAGLFSCAQENSQAPKGGDVHSTEWVNVKFLGTEKFHGEAVAEGNLQSCKVCHGPDLVGVDDAAGCYVCHFGPDGAMAPAGTGWTHGLADHFKYAAYAAVCNLCHGIHRAFGLAPLACHDCHGTGLNHPLGQPWLDKDSLDFHGLLTDFTGCSACHDPDFYCYQCHFGPDGAMAPAGTGWTHGVKSHMDYRQYAPVCNQCHEVNRTYANPPAACHDCH
ncbi:MAG: hypothetical protein JRI97_00810 [Deltaproteobacteria bacterium]|nr:hypothetical protein [Deltaproteobacteria bacterium]